MDDVDAAAEVLAGGRGYWTATPWNYSSLRYLHFARDGIGETTYGFGQTIYAVLKYRWELPASGVLRLMYLEVTQGIRSKGFALSDSNRVKELGYTLTEGEVSGVESIVGQPHTFLWTLELSEPPWPSGMELPFEVPRVFYGHRQQVRKANA